MNETPEIQASLIAEGVPGRIGALIKKTGRDVLAKRTGISPSMITRYSKGMSQPTSEKIIALALAGNVSVSWLLVGDNGPSDKNYPTPDSLPKESGSSYFVATREIDVEAIIAIVSELELALESSDKSLSHTRKAETVAAFFDMYRTAGKPMDKSVLKQLLSTFISSA